MSPQQRHLQVLNITHCCYLMLCAAYISLMYPIAWVACLLLAACGVIVAFMPNTWRQKAIGEICFLAVALAASILQWFLYGSQPQSVNGLCRIIIVTLVLVLVPNRPGLVRPLAMLIALELLLLDRQAPIPISIILFLSTFALSALFLDSWLRHQYHSPIGVRIRNRWVRQPWKPMLVCLILTCLVCYPLASMLQGLGHQHRIILNQNEQMQRNKGHKNISIIDSSLRIGSPLWSDQESYIVARYFPDRTEVLDSEPQTYIRARTVPKFKLEKQGQISWNSPTEAAPYIGPAIANIPLGSGSTLIRFRSGDKVILRPDGSEIPAIEDFYFDSEANLFTDEIDLNISRYRCGLARDSYTRTQQNSQLRDDSYLEVPAYLQDLFHKNIPQLEQWRVLNPEQAAQQITLFLHRNCRYSTKNLPTLKESPAHCIELFLFGPHEAQIGHCQYFATAATLLLRSCGHASRPVFGFSSNERDKESKNSIILRAWHGHAWTEFVNSSGRWQRLDPTPGGYLEQRIGPNPLINDVQENTEVFIPSETTAVPWINLLLLLIGLSGLFVSSFLYKNRKKTVKLSGRQKQLAQQQLAFLHCARQLGINIKDSHTLSAIVRQVELRCGLVLQNELQQHLAALYNHAEVPENWPILRIRQAAQARDATQKNSTKTIKKTGQKTLPKAP